MITCSYIHLYLYYNTKQLELKNIKFNHEKNIKIVHLSLKI